MKRLTKIIISSLIVLTAIGAAAGLSACGHEHTYGEWEDIVNNCTAHVQKHTCAECGREETRTLEAAGHSFGEWQKVENSCTVQTQTCSVCGYKHTRDLGISGHNFGEWYDIVNTCTDHVMERKCLDCGYTTTREMFPDGHDWSEWTVFVDSCTDHVEWRVCSKCIRREYRQDLTVVGHEYEGWKDVINTCTEHIQVGYCQKCGVQSLREVEPKGHTIVGNICVDCGIEVIDGQPLDATERYNSTYGYDYYKANGMLKECALYMRIDAAARKFHLNTDIDATHYGETYYYVDKIEYADLDLTSNEAAAVWKTYKDDNPLYYWISSTLSVEEESRIYLLCYPDYVQGRVRAEKNKLIEDKVKEYAALLRDDDDAYGKALAYHDKIINTIDYAYNDEGKAETAAWAHNILGVFEEKGGVCEAYTRTYQLLLNYSGVENVFVSGTANESHSWNLVKLDDGNWYWCDVTWDDTPNWEWGVSYNYFLVNDTQNVKWQDGGYNRDEITFLDSHTPDTPESEGVHFLYSLPARSESVYEGYLRSTFTVGNCSYVIVGRDVVQLYKIAVTGDVNIPETVTYSGVNYSIISIGGFDSQSKSLGIRGGDVFSAAVSALEPTLTIPASVKFIWDKGVSYSRFKSIIVAEDNEYFRSVDGVLYTKSLRTLVFYPPMREGAEYTVLDGCERTAYGAFLNCKSLKTLNLGKDVKMIGFVCFGEYYDIPRGMFAGSTMSGEMSRISEALDGGTITVDSRNAFISADGKALYTTYPNSVKRLLYVTDFNIQTFEMPADIEMIESDAFADCNRLNSITVADGNEYMTAVGGILYNKDVTQILVVPNAISVNIVIPNTVTDINKSFYGKSSFSSVSFGTNIKELGDGAFAYCGSLTVIYFDGTTNAWKKIKKSDSWCSNTGSIRIVCMDGVLDKYGNLIQAVS